MQGANAAALSDLAGVRLKHILAKVLGMGVTALVHCHCHLVVVQGHVDVKACLLQTVAAAAKAGEQDDGHTIVQAERQRHRRLAASVD